MANQDKTLLEGYLVTPIPMQSKRNSPTVSQASSHASSDNSANNTVIEYFRSAREEIMLRVKYRDTWLTIQLLAQVVLFALAEGVEVAGVRAPAANSIFLLLSFPISLLLVSLYRVEDSIIGYIGNYISAIPEAEARLLRRPWLVRNWDSSQQFRLYGEKALPIRLTAQIVAFLVIPGGLSLVRMNEVESWRIFQEFALVADAFFAVLICAILIGGFLLRRKINNKPVSSILQDITKK